MDVKKTLDVLLIPLKFGKLMGYGALYLTSEFVLSSVYSYRKNKLNKLSKDLSFELNECILVNDYYLDHPLYFMPELFYLNDSHYYETLGSFKIAKLFKDNNLIPVEQIKNVLEKDYRSFIKSAYEHISINFINESSTNNKKETLKKDYLNYKLASIVYNTLIKDYLDYKENNNVLSVLPYSSIYDSLKEFESKNKKLKKSDLYIDIEGMLKDFF